MTDAVLSHTATCHPVIAGASTDNSAYEVFIQKTKRAFEDFLNADKTLLLVDSKGLFDIFLANIPEETRAANVCNTCRQFFDRYGGLVQVDGITGAKFSAIWSDEFATSDLKAAVAAVNAEVSRRKIEGVFVPPRTNLGSASEGGFSHIHVVIPSTLVWRNAKYTADQWEAKLREDHKDLCRALSELTVPMLKDALRLLNMSVLDRSEKHVDRVEWLLKLKDSTVKGRPYDNLIWRAVANAPTGWCQVRSSALSTLFDDLVAGVSFEVISRKWGKKMDPGVYMRPDAAPSAGAVKAAEAIFAKMNLAPSLDRRFARLSDLKTDWTPTAVEAPKTEGLFGHLVTKDAKKSTYEQVSAPAVTMTWAKFQSKHLPSANKIEMLVRSSDYFIGLTTAVHADAEPIFQWDRVERRNPVSWYCYRESHLNTAARWNLKTGTWTEVKAIAQRPCNWYTESAKMFAGSILFLDGCKDVAGEQQAGLGLFPEILRSELHEVRSVMEAFSNDGKLKGFAEAEAFGVVIDGSMQPRTSQPVRLRITDKDGLISHIDIDRFD